VVSTIGPPPRSSTFISDGFDGAGCGFAGGFSHADVKRIDAVTIPIEIQEKVADRLNQDAMRRIWTSQAYERKGNLSKLYNTAEFKTTAGKLSNGCQRVLK